MERILVDCPQTSAMQEPPLTPSPHVLPGNSPGQGPRRCMDTNTGEPRALTRPGACVRAWGPQTRVPSWESWCHELIRRAPQHRTGLKECGFLCFLLLSIQNEAFQELNSSCLTSLISGNHVARFPGGKEHIWVQDQLRNHDSSLWLSPRPT